MEPRRRNCHPGSVVFQCVSLTPAPGFLFSTLRKARDGSDPQQGCAIILWTPRRCITSTNRPTPLRSDLVDCLHSWSFIRLIEFDPSPYPSDQRPANVARWITDDGFSGILVRSYRNGQESLFHCRNFARAKLWTRYRQPAATNAVRPSLNSRS